MKHWTQQLLAFYTLSTKTLCAETVADLNREAATSSSPILFVFTMVWDVAHLPENGWGNIFKILDEFSSKHKHIKLLILLTDWLKDKPYIQQLHKLQNTEIAFVNGIMFTAYNEIYNLQKSDTNKQWNANTNKFLFLTGKWWKLNRLPLFKKLYEKDLIKHSIHSLFLPPISVKGKEINYGHGLSEELHEIFLNLNSNPDNTRTLKHEQNLAYWTHHVSAIPYDHTLYEKTSFRLISETCWEDGIENDPWLTEKTWITIFNRQPFILAGEKFSLKKLQKMGFKTFEEYLPIKYDTLAAEERMEAIVKNTEYWIDNIKKHKHSIMLDVEHNFNHINRLCENDLNCLDNIIKKYNLETSITKLMATTFY